MLSLIATVIPAAFGVHYLYKYTEQLSKIEQLRQSAYASCMANHNDVNYCKSYVNQKYPLPKSNPIVVGSIIFGSMVLSWYLAKALQTEVVKREVVKA